MVYLRNYGEFLRVGRTEGVANPRQEPAKYRERRLQSQRLLEEREREGM
jgi:hypothetical protein